MAIGTTGVTLREAGDGDRVGGVLPRWVALPESVPEVAALLRACSRDGLAVVPVGGGTKLHWGAPPERCDVLLDTCCLNEIVEHATGDLIVRAQAGVTLRALADRLAQAGQELAADAPSGAGETVGGLLATGLAGPRSFRYGTPRDLLIGMTVVLPDGTVARSGGKVVKNVAGYDLGKLFTGSYGTLGVIAEAVFRLHPLPAERRWIEVETGRERVRELAAVLAASRHEPSAVECVSGDGVRVAALVEGTAAAHRAEALLRETGVPGEVRGEAPAWWDEPLDGTHLAEVRCLPSRVGAVLELAAEAGAALRGSPVTGRLLVRTRDPGLPARLRAAGARVVVLAWPEDTDRWGEVSAMALMRRVKERFDPGRTMSPGRFVGGI
jgi:glycolate oxidase FAD binding subunit